MSLQSFLQRIVVALPAVALIGGLFWCSVAAAVGGDTAATVSYLQSLQNTDGGYRNAQPAAESSLLATTSVLRALKHSSIGAPPKKEDARKFVDSCFDSQTGGFSDHPGGKVDTVSTAMGILSEYEVGGTPDPKAFKYLDTHSESFEDLRIAAAAYEAANTKSPRARDWASKTASMVNPDGTYGSGVNVAKETANSVVLLLRVGRPVKARDSVVKALKSGQKADGGFGGDSSDLAACYRIARALVMLKEKPADVGALRKFVGSCKNTDGGYGSAPGKPSSATATYFATMVLSWCDQHWS
jgi:prenyltransferase beta subunit